MKNVQTKIEGTKYKDKSSIQFLIGPLKSQDRVYTHERRWRRRNPAEQSKRLNVSPKMPWLSATWRCQWGATDRRQKMPKKGNDGNRNDSCKDTNTGWRTIDPTKYCRQTPTHQWRTTKPETNPETTQNFLLKPEMMQNFLRKGEPHCSKNMMSNRALK